MFTIPAPTPIAFTVCSIQIYKYGIVMALAIFVAMLVANHLYNLFNIKKGVIIEYAPLMIIFGIFGARLYFCLLNPHFYINHPLEILDIRQGGLSIHGAIIGGFLSLIMIAKRAKTSLFSLLDPLSCAIILGQSIGRWGNYFNSEAFGFPVKGQSWGLFVSPNLRPVQYSQFSLFHPTFLYESVLDLAGFFILLILYIKYGKKHRSITFFSYLIIYSLIRFFIERIRTDSALNVGGIIPIAIIVSILLFFIGITGLSVNLLKK